MNTVQVIHRPFGLVDEYLAIESIKKKSEFRKSLDPILGPYIREKFGEKALIHDINDYGKYLSVHYHTGILCGIFIGENSIIIDKDELRELKLKSILNGI